MGHNDIWWANAGPPLSRAIRAIAAARPPPALEPQTITRSRSTSSVDIVDAPESWEGALTALRLTTDGPGPRQLRYDDLGALAALKPMEINDITAVRDHPDALETLYAMTEHDSVRQAATALHVHHSTLQARLRVLQDALGYRIDTAAGRSRLWLTLALDRLNQNQHLP